MNDKKTKIILIGVMIVFILPLQVKDVAGQDVTHIKDVFSIPTNEYESTPLYINNGTNMLIDWEVSSHNHGELYLLKLEDYNIFLESDIIDNSIFTFNIDTYIESNVYGYHESYIIDEGFYYFLGINTNTTQHFSISFEIWMYSQDESNCTYVNNYYTNDTYVNNTYLNNTYVNNTYVDIIYENNTYENQTNVNDTYENDNYGGVYLNSPQGIGTILSISLIVGSCISLLPYAFNVIKTRILDPKKRRKLGDLDS